MAEAAGLVLAILPLLISTVEHYEDCLKPIQRLCQFTTQAQRFCKLFGIQKTIFRNQCQLLLQNVLEQEDAHKMMIDQKHPTWTDTKVSAQLEEQLDASRDSCVCVIEEIRAVLRRLQIWSSELNGAIEQEGKGHRFGSRTWRSITRTKLKFTFSESSRETTLAELKGLNDSFLTLSSQTSKLYREESKRHSLVKPLAKDIERVKSIQRASCKVYEALGQSCSKHFEHRTHFCLEAKTTGSPENPQIQFNVAFARAALRRGASSYDPVFFIIESIVYDAPSIITPQNSVRDAIVTKKLKRSLETDTASPVKKVNKSVKFQEIECSSLYHEFKPSNYQGLKDLCMHANFCDRLRECMQQSSNAGCCLGFLGDTVPYKHLIYFPEKKTRRPALSLQEIISISSRQEPSRRLSMYERLHLARSLATAVLQYHATPWLKGPWRCKDIYFFDAEERLFLQEKPSPISEPHIDVQITKSNSTSSGMNSGPTEHLAPNIILFNLAVMLIELAYTASLQNLLTPKELSYRDSQYTEFLAARRLGEVVTREMGPKYGQVVKKCLGCHFASGTDLNSPELQAEYHRDVVKELEGLEEDFASLKINQ